jgi:hypothetical protein
MKNPTGLRKFRKRFVPHHVGGLILHEVWQVITLPKRRYRTECIGAIARHVELKKLLDHSLSSKNDSLTKLYHQEQRGGEKHDEASRSQ